MQRSLVIVKPDGVQRGLAATILARLENRGLKMVGLKLMQVSRELAERHYGVHKGKAFYEALVSYITSGPVVVAVFEGPNAISIIRTTMGATNSAEAAPGTIRGDFAIQIGRNLIHGSDSPETAEFEIGLFFGEGGLVSYSRDVDRWIIE
ncbi:MAG TPA: nucleoside-diphosphate kinase [Chloroflexota bacterium]|nr:nucleoside-diphosphate kinase [Chloroflexota bacterium]